MRIVRKDFVNFVQQKGRNGVDVYVGYVGMWIWLIMNVGGCVMDVEGTG